MVLMRYCVFVGNKNIQLAFIPGDDQPDAELVSLSTISSTDHHRLWQYTVHGGLDNALEFLKFCSDLSGFHTDWLEPRPLVRAGLYWPGLVSPDKNALEEKWLEGSPKAAIVFYRALVQAGNTKVVDALINSLLKEGLNPISSICLKPQGSSCCSSNRRDICRGSS